jgi:hypothetical protein
MLFLVTGTTDSSTEPTPEFLQASRDTLEQLGDMERSGRSRRRCLHRSARCVFRRRLRLERGPALALTTLPSFRYASWQVMPLIPFHRDIEMSLDEALVRLVPRGSRGRRRASESVEVPSAAEMSGTGMRGNRRRPG